MNASSMGKRVGRSLYIHRSALSRLDREQQDRVALAEEIAGFTAWSVAKLCEDADQASLLIYEEFDAPFPALLESLTVNCASGQVLRRSYRARDNPPILHRKELLLDPEDPRRPVYAALTAALEARGLFEDTRSIGTRAGWAARLDALGVTVVDHALVEQAGVPVIPRHLAALRRDGLSSPIQALWRLGLLAPGDRLFDYGCGHGSDVESLRGLGVEASGWDPYYAAAQPKVAADVVNLGFVLNVIEAPDERKLALREAFSLAARCLAVAVITDTSARPETRRPFGDGFLTRRGTFQKLFSDQALKRFVEDVLGVEAFRAGPGLVLAFADPLAEQTFLVERQRRWRPAPLYRPSRSERDDARRAGLAAELEAIGALALGLGRAPAISDLGPQLMARLEAETVEPERVIRWALEGVDPVAFGQSQAQRRDDLLLYLALNLFERRKPYGQLPPGLQRDVRALLGSYNEGQALARDLLFSLGKPETCAQAIAVAETRAIGRRDAKGALTFHVDDLGRLPLPLRLLVGCASRYHGGLEESDLIKIHAHGGKVTALRFEAFDHALPRLSQRIKIDLRGQRIDEFDHHNQDQRLVGKSRWLSGEHPMRQAQAMFDQALLAGWPDPPDQAAGFEIDARLAAAGLTRQGYRLTSSSA